MSINPEEVRHVPPGLECDQDNIGIDFDGVIHAFDKGYFDGTCYGDPIEGVGEALKDLSKSYRIVIFTAKVKPDRPLVQGKTGMELVTEWLVKHGLSSYISEITCEKPRAKFYIDDKAVRFIDWRSCLKEISQYE